MKRFLITTPHNPTYDGKTFWVKFTDGRAVVDELTLPKKPGVTTSLDELVWKFQHEVVGYEVRELGEVPPDIEAILAQYTQPVSSDRPREDAAPVIEMAGEAPTPAKAEKAQIIKTARRGKRGGK